MAERSFETELDAWFHDSPRLADSALFADRVILHLDRSWTLRRVIIGGLGLVGGLIGGAQVLDSGLLHRLGVLESRPGLVGHALTDRIQDSALAQSPIVHDAVTRLATLGGGSSQVLWMSVAMALFAAGLLVTRAVREL